MSETIELEFNITNDYGSATGGKGRLKNKYGRYWYANQAIFDLIRKGYVEIKRELITETKIYEYKRGEFRDYKVIWCKLTFIKNYINIVDLLT